MGMQIPVNWVENAPIQNDQAFCGEFVSQPLLLFGTILMLSQKQLTRQNVYVPIESYHPREEETKKDNSLLEIILLLS